MTGRLMKYFATVAATAALGAGVAVAQPDETDVFRPQDTKFFRALACSKDRAPQESFFSVTPSFSDAQRLNTHMDRAMLQAAVEKTWRAIASTLTGQEMYAEEYAEKANAVIGKQAQALQQVVEDKSGGISLLVEEITNRPMDPNTEPDAPVCR